MAFEFNQMSKNGQWGLVGLFCAVAAGVFYMYVWQPNAEQAVTLAGQVETIELENERTRLVAGQLEDLEREVATMEGQLETLSHILPEQRETGELLRRLQSAAADTNIEMRRFENQPPVLHDFYAEVPVQLDLTGNFHDLAMFFDRVSKFGRIVTVGDVSIQATTDAGSSTIQSQCTASTFYFLPEVAGADPEAAQTTGG